MRNELKLEPVEWTDHGTPKLSAWQSAESPEKGDIVLALQFTSYNNMSHVLKPKITSFDPFLKAKQEF